MFTKQREKSDNLLNPSMQQAGGRAKGFISHDGPVPSPNHRGFYVTFTYPGVLGFQGLVQLRDDTC
jgi:hypothetical protein